MINTKLPTKIRNSVTWKLSPFEGETDLRTVIFSSNNSNRVKVSCSLSPSSMTVGKIECHATALDDMIKMFVGDRIAEAMLSFARDMKVKLIVHTDQLRSVMEEQKHALGFNDVIIESGIPKR